MTSRDINKEILEQFSAIDIGKSLENYLHEDAWEKDEEGETRVYLVKDDDEKIALFFSIKCGLLYGNPQYDELDADKREFVDLLMDAYSSNSQDALADYYATGMYEMVEMNRLFKIAENRAKSKKKNKESNETARTLNVEVCYSAIEIQHFCRNSNYHMDQDVGVPLGFGIFWEVIIPIIKDITRKLGCKYLYLFAADNTQYCGENTSKTLVQYYMNDLKFNNVEDKVIIRPNYDEDCSPLYQSVEELDNNLESVWEEFSDVT
ncbi:MAG: hypothetical protein RSF88_12200 [Lachnospiraceae bacterium]